MCAVLQMPRGHGLPRVLHLGAGGVKHVLQRSPYAQHGAGDEVEELHPSGVVAGCACLAVVVGACVV